MTGQTEMVSTPCRRICKQDREAGYCIGCGRTVREVFMWSELPDLDRARVLRELPDRLARLEPD